MPTTCSRCPVINSFRPLVAILHGDPPMGPPVLEPMATAARSSGACSPGQISIPPRLLGTRKWHPPRLCCRWVGRVVHCRPVEICQASPSPRACRPRLGSQTSGTTLRPTTTTTTTVYRRESPACRALGTLCEPPPWTLGSHQADIQEGQGWDPSTRQGRPTFAGSQ